MGRGKGPLLSPAQVLAPAGRLSAVNPWLVHLLFFNIPNSFYLLLTSWSRIRAESTGESEHGRGSVRVGGALSVTPFISALHTGTPSASLLSALHLRQSPNLEYSRFWCLKSSYSLKLSRSSSSSHTGLFLLNKYPEAKESSWTSFLPFPSATPSGSDSSPTVHLQLALLWPPSSLRCFLSALQCLPSVSLFLVTPIPLAIFTYIGKRVIINASSLSPALRPKKQDSPLA